MAIKTLTFKITWAKLVGSKKCGHCIIALATAFKKFLTSVNNNLNYFLEH